MRRIAICLFLGWISFGANLVIAQDSKRELENISRTYKELESYKCKVSVKVFETYTSVTPVESIESTVFHSSNKYLYSMGGTIQLTDGNAHVIVDSSNKAIVISEKPKGFGTAQQMELDTIIKYFSAEIVTKPTGTSLGRMVMKPVASFKNFSEMEKLEIFYDKNYIIAKWVMYSSLSLDIKNDGESKTKPRLEMSFGKISSVTPNEQVRLDKKYYYYQKGNSLYPSDKYKSFNIIDGRIKVSK